MLRDVYGGLNVAVLCLYRPHRYVIPKTQFIEIKPGTGFSIGQDHQTFGLRFRRVSEDREGFVCNPTMYARPAQTCVAPRERGAGDDLVEFWVEKGPVKKNGLRQDQRLAKYSVNQDTKIAPIKAGISTSWTAASLAYST